MAEAKQPIIHTFGAVGLIVRRASGVLYSNQAGGISCQHPSTEGVFIPLPRLAIPDNLLVDKYGGRCEDDIDEEDATVIDNVLAAGGVKATVTRDMLKHCMEAWVFVTLHEDVHYEYEGLAPCEAVFVWGNSD